MFWQKTWRRARIATMSDAQTPLPLDVGLKQLNMLADGNDKEYVDAYKYRLGWTAAADRPTYPHCALHQLTQNMTRMPEKAAPQLHEAAPLAPILRETTKYDDSEPNAANEQVVDEVAAKYSISDEARRDFYASREQPPDPEWPTYDTILKDKALERQLDDISKLIDELDEPPVASQRLAELVLERPPMPHTRSKYFAALRRVLQVSVGASVAQFSAPDPHPTPSWPIEPKSGTQVPPLSPIPFLKHEDGALGLPPGPVDEVDTAENGGEHGGVSDTLRPLSAATEANEDEHGAKRVKH